MLEPSDLTPINTPPSSPDAVRELGYVLAADFSDAITVRSFWRTSVSGALSSAEQRRMLVDRPSRTVNVPHVTFGADQSVNLQMMMARAALSRSLFPLYSDMTALAQPVAAGGTILTCDATLRRFFPGGRVVVFSFRSGDAQVTGYEVATIASLTAAALTLTAPLVSAFAAGSRVVPLIESEVTVSRAQVLDDRKMRATLQGIELVGPMGLPSTRIPGTLPPGYQEHDGLPILVLPAMTPRGTELTNARDGETVDVGLGRIGDFRGARGRVGTTYPVQFMERLQAWRFLQFFDSRAGRTFPFWAISPVGDYRPSAITSSTVTIAQAGHLADWALRPHVAVMLGDGTIHVRKVAGTARFEGQDTITFDAPLPSAPSLSAIRRVCAARLVRFASDEITERWRTLRHMETTAELVELLQEKEITVEGIERRESQRLISRWRPTLCGADDSYPPLMGYELVECPPDCEGGRTCTVVGSPVTPSIASENTVSFGSHAAGTYRVRYVSGGLKYSPSQGYRAGNFGCGGGYCVIHSGSVVINAPTSYAASKEYATIAELQAAHAGEFVEFEHAGGTIGVRFLDEEYPDNTGPGATFELLQCGGCGGDALTCANASFSSQPNVTVSAASSVQTGTFDSTNSGTTAFSCMWNWLGPSSLNVQVHHITSALTFSNAPCNNVAVVPGDIYVFVRINGVDGPRWQTKNPPGLGVVGDTITGTINITCPGIGLATVTFG